MARRHGTHAYCARLLNVPARFIRDRENCAKRRHNMDCLRSKPIYRRRRTGWCTARDTIPRFFANFLSLRSRPRPRPPPPARHHRRQNFRENFDVVTDFKTQNVNVRRTVVDRLLEGRIPSMICQGPPLVVPTAVTGFRGATVRFRYYRMSVVNRIYCTGLGRPPTARHTANAVAGLGVVAALNAVRNNKT